jgi:hypothetical protein
VQRPRRRTRGKLLDELCGDRLLLFAWHVFERRKCDVQTRRELQFQASIVRTEPRATMRSDRLVVGAFSDQRRQGGSARAEQAA